ncbi:MAG: C40 family peptidase [Flammeovirgaceae bacterium]|nr:C40 family peptidase [Flammeovirgaceae bacterium]MDW8288902.1 NlpC/P60 family protein [Flammeovirgaceae bacterium]
MKIIIPLLLLGIVSFAFVFSGNIQEDLMEERVAKFKSSGIEKPLILKRNTTADLLVSEARKYVGAPSKELSPIGFTKEEFIQTVLSKYAYEKFNQPLEDFARHGKLIRELKDLKKGDVVYFMDLTKTEPVFSHAGIYVGDGEFIYLSVQKGVAIGSLTNSEFWRSKFAFGTRLIP